jgi:LysR family transcriptional regulator, low CO2-responsive transcriptional regulator
VAIDDRINLQKLQVFDRVVTLGGISRAADQMKVAQPVVTEHIQSLERRLGARLFEREGRRLVLTEVGRAAHEWCTDVLRRTREFDRELEGLSDGLRGSIVIGTSMSTGSYELPSLLSAFGRRHPDVRIRVDVTGAEHAIEATMTGRNDLSVVAVQSPPALGSLVSEQIGADEVVLVAPPLGITTEQLLTVKELAELPFVEAQGGSLRRSFIDSQFEEVGLPSRRVVMEFGHPEAIKTAVANGVGLACLFRSAVRRELQSGELREIAVQGVRIEAPVWLVHRRNRTLSPVHIELMAEIRSYFAAP